MLGEELEIGHVSESPKRCNNVHTGKVRIQEWLSKPGPEHADPRALDADRLGHSEDGKDVPEVSVLQKVNTRQVTCCRGHG